MGFLSKLFGKDEEKKASKASNVSVRSVAKKSSIPEEKVGLDGKFDESGLAKRVALALDKANISDDVGLWVAQSGSTVILKYNDDAKNVISKAKDIARKVDGASSVEAIPNS